MTPFSAGTQRGRDEVHKLMVYQGPTSGQNACGLTQADIRRGSPLVLTTVTRAVHGSRSSARRACHRPNRTGRRPV